MTSDSRPIEAAAMKIAAEGTFFYCKGAIATDGWVLDCEGGDVATQDEALKLIVKYLHAKIVEVPELQAKLASLKALEQAKGGGAPNA